MASNPDPTTGRYINGYVDIETWKRMKVECILKDRTMSELVCEIVTKHFSEKKKAK